VIFICAITGAITDENRLLVGRALRDAVNGDQFVRQLFARDFGIVVSLHVESRNAVSALTPRLPWTISLIRRGGTSIALAIRVLREAKRVKEFGLEDLAGVGATGR
jgi:hypothetical protein